ncbi:triacylglycerol lipase OBL1 [Ziziphus jujuba]|uniref:Triacylglycerol lipase OBL1 n=1 Tax=Ziziphus jujuba TaxID=326968 RepID=A0A6P4A845_ZIZJJ|nr:triacylglycerol lipase OBL1 [Ziziphus jujuba]
MACKENVCNDYMVLKPMDAGFVELIRLLISSKLEERSFIECSEEEGREPRNFGRRWLIFVSVVVQKVLLYVRDPMAQLGHMLVLWLNLVSANGGHLMLFIKRLKGEEVQPDPLSLVSVVGNLDSRVELDDKVKAGNKKYEATLCIMASKLSYENQTFIENVVQNHWKMQFLGFYNFWNGYLDEPSTRAFIFQDKKIDPELIVVAFRGTDPFDADAWRTDFDISWYKLKNVGKMHGGFVKALGLQRNNSWPSEIQQQQDSDQKRFAYYEIRKLLKDILQENKSAKFIVTGHSLGGALAILFVAGLAIHEEAWLMEKLEAVYTFGQPRVGDKQFGEFMNEKLEKFGVRYMRFVYCNDMVPRVPFDDKTLFFKHFGPCLYYNSFYQGKVVSEEPNKNYFSLLWFIPKCLNAVWELIRSFIIPCIKGPEYKESWFMRVFRVVGLVIPGITAHLPPDYVNVTRLGSLPSFTGVHDPIQREDYKAD